MVMNTNATIMDASVHIWIKLMSQVEMISNNFAHMEHKTSPLVQSIWGQNGLNPPQIATKIKLTPCCREFCEDFRKQKFTKINRVEHFQIAQFLCEPWGKILKKIGFGTFHQYGQIHVYFKSVWFMFVIKLLKTLYGRTNVCSTNYSLD